MEIWIYRFDLIADDALSEIQSPNIFYSLAFFLATNGTLIRALASLTSVM